MNIMGVDLGSLAVLGGAIGVGLGFGLQKIASNFISGVILLVEGQATVGDYVELDGGEAGTIIKMTARATFLETYDGRWIVVPNEDFITTRVVNYSVGKSGASGDHHGCNAVGRAQVFDGWEIRFEPDQKRTLACVPIRVWHDITCV